APARRPGRLSWTTVRPPPRRKRRLDMRAELRPRLRPEGRSAAGGQPHPRSHGSRPAYLVPGRLAMSAAGSSRGPAVTRTETPAANRPNCTLKARKTLRAQIVNGG